MKSNRQDHSTSGGNNSEGISSQNEKNKAALEVLAAILRFTLGDPTSKASLREDERLGAALTRYEDCDNSIGQKSYKYLHANATVDNQEAVKLSYEDAVRTFAIDLLLGDSSSFEASHLIQRLEVQNDTDAELKNGIWCRYDLSGSFNFYSTSFVFGKMFNQLMKSDVDLAFKKKMSLVENYDEIGYKESIKEKVLKEVFDRINESTIALHINEYAPLSFQLKLFSSLMQRQHQVRMFLDKEYQRKINQKCKEFGITRDKYIRVMQRHYCASFSSRVYHYAYHGTESNTVEPKILIKNTELISENTESGNKFLTCQPVFQDQDNAQAVLPKHVEKDHARYIEQARVIASSNIMNNEKIRFYTYGLVSIILDIESFSLNMIRYFYSLDYNRMYFNYLDKISNVKEKMLSAFSYCKTEVECHVQKLASVCCSCYTESIKPKINEFGTALIAIGYYLQGNTRSVGQCSGANVDSLTQG